MKYAYKWGQSDVDASKLVVASDFARLQGNREFQADLQKAKAEFAKLKKK